MHSQIKRFQLQTAGNLMPVEEIRAAPQVLDTDIANYKLQEDLGLGVCSK